MKVLSIGNSFSQDAHKWLHKLAEKNGYEIETANLYIGGCNLERHWNNYIENKADYSWELNGCRGERNISLNEALEIDSWDVVTIQQASPLSGRPQSYFPYLQNIASVVREKQPQAKIYFFQTWSYEIDIESKSFDAYNRDQMEMYRRILDTSEMASKVLEAPLIPVGRVIQKIRECLPEFDYRNGGMSLNRDGYHLSLDYGRFTAAATFFCKLTGEKIKIREFEDFDMSLVNKIIAVVEDIVFE
jgi:hypothetical protein